MDGNPIDITRHSDEARRQDLVFEQAMRSLERKHRRKVAAGHAVMTAFDSFGQATRGNGFLARATRLSKFALALFLGATSIYFFWVFVMQG